MSELSIEIMECLDEIRSYLPKLARACESSGELLYEPLKADSLNIIQQVVQGFNNLHQLIEFTISKLDKAHLVWQKPLADTATNLQHVLMEIDHNLKDNNYVAAGDLFKYEGPVICEELLTHLGVIGASKAKFLFNQKLLHNRFSISIEQFDQFTYDDDQYQVVFTKSGLPNLFISAVDTGSRFFYSKYNPEYEATCWVQTIPEDIKDKRAVLFWGIGFGYHLKAFRSLYPNHHIYLYEPNEQVLAAAMGAADLEEVFDSPRFHSFLVGEGESTIRQLAALLYYLEEEMVILELPIYNKVLPVQKERIMMAVNASMQEIVLRENTAKRFQDITIENVLKNLPIILNTPSLTGLKNKLDGYSAVIVGAGPSLDYDIEMLKKIKNNALIIAAGTAVQSLQLHGLKPHFIVSMDGFEVNYIAFKEIKVDSIPFLFFPSINYRITDNKTASFIHAFFHFDPLSEYLLDITDKDPVFIPTHSVTGSAIQAAIYMGCTEIIFAGQDFSYSNHKLYSSGSNHLNININYQHYLIEQASEIVENVMGTVNKTDPKLKLTLQDIEALISKYKSVKFTNTTRMGAKINHAPFEPIEQTLLRLQSKEISETVLNDLVSDLPKLSSQRIGGALKKLMVMPEELKTVHSLLISITTKINDLKIFRNVSPIKLKSLMGKIESEWSTVVSASVFDSIYVRSMSSQIIEFDHKRPLIEKESNSECKAELIVEILGELVNEMLNKSEHFQLQVSEAIEYAHEKGFVLDSGLKKN